MVIVHASPEFRRHFACEVSWEDRQANQPGRLLSWSADVVRIGSEPFLLLVNDASLYSLLLPARGFRDLPDFSSFLLERVRDLWDRLGQPFDPGAHPVLVLPRTNRELAGAMDEATEAIRFHHHWSREGGPPFNAITMQNRLNETASGMIDDEFPRDRLARLVRHRD